MNSRDLFAELKRRNFFFSELKRRPENHSAKKAAMKILFR
jgi:hypothetical protein